MAERAYIGIGSNLGDPVAQVRRAIRDLAKLGPLRASSLYKSEPLGDRRDPWYVNAVVELETALEPEALLRWLQELERRAGRPADRPRWTPRVLDLDLLLYGDRILDTPGLRVPHPGLASRRFVLEPLAELSPDLVSPQSKRTIRELLESLDDALRVEELPG